MSTDPYAPPASSAYNSRSDSRTPLSRLGYLGGIVSVITFAYMTCLHGLLVSFAARGQIHQMDVVVSYPPIMTIHILVCTFGMAVAVYLLIMPFVIAGFVFGTSFSGEWQLQRATEWYSTGIGTSDCKRWNDGSDS